MPRSAPRELGVAVGLTGKDQISSGERGAGRGKGRLEPEEVRRGPATCPDRWGPQAGAQDGSARE